MIKCLIFDFDGLILDTETPVYAAWKDIYQQHGCELSMEKWVLSIGTDFHAFDPVDELELQLNRRLDRLQLLTDQRDRTLQRVISQQILPGVREMIDQARQKGLKVALASSSEYEWIHSNLSRLGILDLFDCIRTADNVQVVKPAPDLFLAALDCLGLKPEEAIVFEDSLNGIAAAHTAGIFCVAVPNVLTAHMEFDHANLILKSMDELTLDQLLLAVDRCQPE